jgi:hypothetical protein
MEKEIRTELSELGEFGLIKHLTDQVLLQNNTSIKGVGDDAAILSAPDGQKRYWSQPICSWREFISIFHIPRCSISATKALLPT